jgi:hypothetical protein
MFLENQTRIVLNSQAALLVSQLNKLIKILIDKVQDMMSLA